MVPAAAAVSICPEPPREDLGTVGVALGKPADLAFELRPGGFAIEEVRNGGSRTAAGLEVDRPPRPVRWSVEVPEMFQGELHPEPVLAAQLQQLVDTRGSGGIVFAAPIMFDIPKLTA